MGTPSGLDTGPVVGTVAQFHFGGGEREGWSFGAAGTPEMQTRLGETYYEVTVAMDTGEQAHRCSARTATASTSASASRCAPASSNRCSHKGEPHGRTQKRGMIIHFIDGSKKMLEFPQQVADSDATAAARLKEALEARHLVIEADGALVVIPFENVKYLQLYPAPKKLPAGVIQGASFKD